MITESRSLPAAGSSASSSRRFALLQAILLGGIMLLGAVLRFQHLTDRGLILWDEAKFSLEGIRVENALAALLGLGGNPILGKAVGSAKPTHALLIGLAYALLGTHDWSGLMMNATFSLLELPLVFLIGRRLFSPAVGLIAALLLAVSEYDVMYARSTLSESDSACLLLAGVLLWLGAHDRRRLALAATVIGLAFTTNYRIVLYIGAIVLFDLIWTWRQQGRRAALGRIPAWCALAVAPLLWEALDLAAAAHGITLFQGDLVPGQHSYLGQVYYQLHEGKQSVLHFEPILYLQWYLGRTGWLASLLLLGGFALALRYRTRPWLVLAVPVLLPYAIYIFAPFVVPRNLVAALPFCALLAAAALIRLTAPLRRGLYPALLVALIAALLGCAMTWRLGAERSGFATISGWVQRHGGRTLTSTELTVFYLRGYGPSCLSPALPLTLTELATMRRAGYRYVVIDVHHTTDVSLYIQRHAHHLLRVPALGRILPGENPIASENSDPPDAAAPVEYVDLYDLRGLALPPAGGRPESCSRDHIQ